MAGEFGGYLARYLSVVNPYNNQLWLAQLLLIILSPNFLAATDYILMARLSVPLTLSPALYVPADLALMILGSVAGLWICRMLFVAPELAVISPKWIGTIFIGSSPRPPSTPISNYPSLTPVDYRLAA